MKKLFLMTALLFGGLGFIHVEAAEDVPPLGRICNPIASNISICNA